MVTVRVEVEAHSEPSVNARSRGADCRCVEGEPATSRPGGGDEWEAFQALLEPELRATCVSVRSDAAKPTTQSAA